MAVFTMNAPHTRPEKQDQPVVTSPYLPVSPSHHQPPSAPCCRLAHSLSLRSGARLDLKEFVAGGAAPFPLLRPAPTHAAQHLLLDARLALPAVPEGGASAPEAEALAAAFAAASGLLREALADAGLLLQPKQAGALPQANGTGKDEDGAQSAFYQCQDGYAAAVWHGATTSLSGGCSCCRRWDGRWRLGCPLRLHARSDADGCQLRCPCPPSPACLQWTAWR
jgi:hypothetical protein